MSIFRDFFVKEKPVFTGIARGVGGFGFGASSGAAGPSGISATGGTTITDGGYTYHVYTVDTPAPESNLNVTSGSGTIELLVVGGGGGASFDNSGGGGAGGIAYASALPVSAATYTVSVGPGGQGSNTYGYPGHPSGNPTRGTNSTFVHPVGTITGLGGAGPANEDPSYSVDTPVPSNVYPGGSGSGGKYTAPAVPPPNSIAAVPAAQPSEPTFGGLVTHYGNPGGNAPGGADFTGGGGGGAGGAGSNGSPGPNAGGPGQPFTGFPAPVLEPAIPAPERPNWTPAVGPTGLFGGGGGGCSESSPYNGTGGPGGGGPGGNTDPTGEPGKYGTGGGGGGSGGDGNNGGSGIVILRYLA